MSETLFKFAALCDKFRYTLDEIGDLTDWQIKRILFYPRKKTGELEYKREEPKPIEPTTFEEAIDNTRLRKREYLESYQAIFNAFQNSLLTKENYQEAIKKLQAKYADCFIVKEPEAVVEHVATYQESYRALYQSYVNGLISKEMFDEAVKQLPKQ